MLFPQANPLQAALPTFRRSQGECCSARAVAALPIEAPEQGHELDRQGNLQSLLYMHSPGLGGRKFGCFARSRLSAGDSHLINEVPPSLVSKANLKGVVGYESIEERICVTIFSSATLATSTSFAQDATHTLSFL